MIRKVLLSLVFALGCLKLGDGLSQASVSISSSASLEAFHSWADNVAGIVRRVAVMEEPDAGGGKGLVATHDLQPGEMALEVPLSITLQTEGVRDNNFASVEDDWAGVLAAKLWTEKTKSFASETCPNLGPYFSVGLPTEPPRHPCWWTSAERGELQNSTLVSVIASNAQWRRTQLQRNKPKDARSADYLTLLDLVASRALGQQQKQQASEGARLLVPLLDNANHAPSEAGGGCFEVSQKDKVIRLYAGRRGVKAGSPVYLDYGARTTEDFLVHYGFVPTRCPSDSATVPLDHQENTVVSWSSIRGFGQGHADPKVRKACRRLLDSLPTSLTHDVQKRRAMSPSEENSSMVMALDYRIAKKSLLAACVGRTHDGGEPSMFE